MLRRGCGAPAGQSLSALRRDRRGAGTAEYVLLVGCVGLLALLGFRRFGSAVHDKVSSHAECVMTLACGPGSPEPGEAPDETTTTSGTVSPLGYGEQLDAALQTLAGSFDAITGGDGIVSESDLQAALHSSDAEIAAAARFLLDNPSALHALDVGQGEGDVDGDISLEDVGGLQKELADGDLNEILADTANGEGGRDGDVSREDLQALLEDPGVPSEVHEWAAETLATMPEDDGCSGPFCVVTGAAGWVADTASDAAGWTAETAGDAAGWVGDRAVDAYHVASDVASWQLRYGPLGFQVGVLRGAWATVTSTAWAVTHPVDTLQGLNYFAAHPVETLWHLGDNARANIADNPAQGLGQLGFDIGSFFIPGGGATKAGKAADIATTATGVAGAASAGDGASDAHVPGWVSVIDDASLLVNPVGAPARVVEWIFG